jgi:hypothetical protein
MLRDRLDRQIDPFPQKQHETGNDDDLNADDEDNPDPTPDSAGNHFDGHMAATIHGGGGSDKGEPYHGELGDFLDPNQGIVQYVSDKYPDNDGNEYADQRDDHCVSAAVQNLAVKFEQIFFGAFKKANHDRIVLSNMSLSIPRLLSSGFSFLLRGCESAEGLKAGRKNGYHRCPVSIELFFIGLRFVRQGKFIPKSANDINQRRRTPETVFR